ncbi:hypothetical protein A5696_15510 [Mycobacterium sp. E2699]|uniref:hypothetical protein n=1 Tax=Mycobacterium sp. E2699 TaxID=1834137 RepID=UPI000801EAFA|nr:hypothetical protein [Mycobacterium sp. E2699]OBH00630.1 hypothetical protein A5696_15510 [Mycobacterium sp. E2699]
MADDALDSLYWAEPDAFTALRAELVAEAKRQGDAAAAKHIGAARKPTTAAWIVNRLALDRKDTKARLADLGDRLRAAHAEMDGERIRALSAEQHKLIDELTRAALAAAEVNRPSASVREDVAGTLQAAIADPDITERLGRLAKPESWSGFGVGEAAPAERSGTAAERRQEKLKKGLADAERAKAEADATLSERKADRDAARQRRDEARAVLRDAERRLDKAEAACDEAQRAGRAAAESVKEAKAQLKRA